MRTSAGFWDAIFGKKVTIELPMPDGTIRCIRATERWTPRMFTEEANKVFARRLGEIREGP